ncbi:MAG TPA: hypothetical protein VFA27_11390 [Vicinamibacterales bacterium]|nr:hypothetical protein [Vicinamibacterales bacterium]
MRLPAPLLLLLGGVAVAALLTWILPAGQFDRRDDPATGRRVVVAGTYHGVERAPVGVFGAAVGVARGFIAAADVIAVVLFVGGAWVVLDKLGALGAVIADLVNALGAGGGLWTIPLLSLFFASMGALENMQEEIIPLVPALVVLGNAIGVDGVTVVAMSAGAAMIGSAFGPTNPFQAGIALKVAQLPPLTAGGLRVAVFVVALAMWIGWTLWHARRTRTPPSDVAPAIGHQPSALKSRLALVAMLLPMAAYVYGVMKYDWGFSELAGAFLLGGLAAGLIGGFGVVDTLNAYIEGMQALLPASMLIGTARAISLVLEDGHVVDTILNAFASALARMPPITAGFVMVPFQAVLHVAVPSVSGQAVLTMPLMVPLTDLLHLPRLVAVLAYTTGAGLTELLTPTNGALLAVVVAAGVPFRTWLRFAVVGVAIAALVAAAEMWLVMR